MPQLACIQTHAEVQISVRCEITVQAGQGLLQLVLNCSKAKQNQVLAA